MTILLSPILWFFITVGLVVWAIVVLHKNYQPRPTLDSDEEETSGLEGFIAGNTALILGALAVIALIIFVVTLTVSLRPH